MMYDVSGWSATVGEGHEVREVEIDLALDLAPEESALLDMHTFLNVINVLVSELYLLEDYLEEERGLAPGIERIWEMKELLMSPDGRVMLPEQLEEDVAFILDNVRTAMEAAPKRRTQPDVQQSVDNIHSIFNILRVRVRELLASRRYPERWEPHDIDRLVQNIIEVLAAIEKNSKGRYRIVYNIAAQDETAYVVHLRIDSVDGDTIMMPPVLQDVLRDLIANARKYTKPGGHIIAGLFDDGEHLRFVVEDTGRGIPPDEIVHVIGFGQRGSNVLSTETKGGGFGLTKAYLVAKQFGGRMWIASQLGAGTRITLSIPRPG